MPIEFDPFDKNQVLYTDEVKAIIHNHRWNTGGRLILDVQEKDLAVYITLYRENLNQFDSEELLSISRHVGEVINKVRKLGCPCYLEVKKSVPQ